MVRLLNGSQSYLDYLPEKHTDFILLYFLKNSDFGSIFILLLYIIITWRIVSIGNISRSVFVNYIASVPTAFFIYVAVNMEWF